MCLSCTRLVLHTIKTRYAHHSIYTYSGIVLIAVNPFQRVSLYGPEIIQAYMGRRKGDLEPHLFAIAEDAYTNMQKEGVGQTIIVSGESSVINLVYYIPMLTWFLNKWCRKN
jgi:myosin V